MKITNNFYLNEFMVSDTAKRLGLQFPSPSKEIINNITDLCINVLQPLRDHYGRPIIITSAWRPVGINRAVGGSKRSQHLLAQAADIVIPGVPSEDVAKSIIEISNNFDQIIEEFGRWVHVSYNKNENRQTVLHARKINGKTTYLRGLENGR